MTMHLQNVLIMQMCRFFCWSLLGTYDLWGVKEESLEKRGYEKNKDTSIDQQLTNYTNESDDYIYVGKHYCRKWRGWFIVVSEYIQQYENSWWMTLWLVDAYMT